jgi:hypothetical protein
MGSLSLFHHHVSRSLPQRFQVLVLLVSLPIFDRLPSRVISVSYVESTGNLLRTSSRSLPQRFQVIPSAPRRHLPIFDRLPFICAELVLLDDTLRFVDISFPIFDRLPSICVELSD